jgi:circadian clock protein KaiB
MYKTRPSDGQPTPTSAAQAAEAPVGGAGHDFVFMLFITGTTGISRRAVANIKRLCDEHLAGRYDLEVIDLFQCPEASRDANVVAAPTLIKKLPLPVRRFIGDLSDTDRILLALRSWHEQPR